MSVTATLIAALSTSLSAGVVVDATASAETHVTEPGPTAQQASSTAGVVDVGNAVSGTFVLKPGISAAASRAGMLGAVSYVPSISLVSTSLTPAILHTADVRGELPLGPRLLVRGTLGGSFGDLDPATAQLALSNSAGVLDPVTLLSYATATTSLGASLRASRTLSFDIGANGSVTTSPGGSSSSSNVDGGVSSKNSVPTAYAGAADAALDWRFTHVDALRVGAETRGLQIDGRGTVAGVAPTLGYRRQLGPSAGAELKLGVGVVGLDTSGATTKNGFGTERKNDGFYPLPVVDARVHGLYDLAGAAKLELSANGGVDLSSDPLGALLEDRLTLGAGVGYRATRQVTFHVETGGFYSLFSKELPPPTVVNEEVTLFQVATAVLNNRASIVWAFMDGMSLEASGLATSRLVDNFISTDVTVGLALAGTIPIYHAGDRPAGSDQRAGHDIGAPPIGTAPPLGATTITEPEPLESYDEEPPPPEALRGPPPNVPIVETPLQLDTLKRPTRAEEAKKKKQKSLIEKNGGAVDVDPLNKPAPTPAPGSSSSSSSSSSTPATPK